jgi:hypothetical protein
MAILQVWTYRVKPGRFEDFLAQREEVAQIARDAGITRPVSLRIFEDSLSGPDTGLVHVVVEQTDWETLGRNLDLVVGSENYARYQMLRGEHPTADAPAELVSKRVLIEMVV